MPINPCFHRFPAEAAIIGRLLAAFGELEVTVCYNAGKATNLGDLVVAALYRIRATRSRLEAADALMRPIYTTAGFSELYGDAFGRVMHCLRIRNQFAHCNWGDHETAGLFFVDLQVAAERPDFAFHWKHVDAPLLRSHETYFDGALEALRFRFQTRCAANNLPQIARFGPSNSMLGCGPNNATRLFGIDWLCSAKRA